MVSANHASSNSALCTILLLLNKPQRTKQLQHFYLEHIYCKVKIHTFTIARPLLLMKFVAPLKRSITNCQICSVRYNRTSLECSFSIFFLPEEQFKSLFHKIIQMSSSANLTAALFMVLLTKMIIGTFIIRRGHCKKYKPCS